MSGCPARGSADAGRQHRHVGGWPGRLKVAEDEAVGAVRADPAALGPGRSIVNGGGGGGGGVPAPPRNRPEITAVLEAAVLTTLTTIEPPAGTLTGKWSQAPALKLVVRAAVRGPLPSSTVMVSRRVAGIPSRPRRGGACRCRRPVNESRARTSVAWYQASGPPLRARRALEAADVGRRLGPGRAGPGALLEGVADAGRQHRHVGGCRLVEGREDEAVGAVRADPAALVIDADRRLVRGAAPAAVLRPWPSPSLSATRRPRAPCPRRPKTVRWCPIRSSAIDEELDARDPARVGGHR